LVSLAPVASAFGASINDAQANSVAAAALRELIATTPAARVLA
jgi:hypothetical protein